MAQLGESMLRLADTKTATSTMCTSVTPPQKYNVNLTQFTWHQLGLLHLLVLLLHLLLLLHGLLPHNHLQPVSQQCFSAVANLHSLEISRIKELDIY